MKRLLLCILAVAAAAGAQAQRVVTLEECRQMAVENNAKVRIARNNAEAAEATSREAFTKYFPTVEAEGMWFRSNKPMIGFNVLDMVTVEFLKKGQGASIYALQPIFAGGRIVNGNKLAHVGVEASRLEQQSAVDDATLTVEQYYWRLVTLKSKRATLQSVIEMVDTLKCQVGAAVDAGIVLRNDLLKVQLKDNEYRSLMVDLDNGIALASKQLAQYIGLDGEQVDIADAAIPDVVPEYPLDIFVDAEQALPATVDYRLLQQSVRAADLRRRMTLGDYLPAVALGAGYFYDDALGDKHSFGAVMVNVNIPISNWWGGSYAIKKSGIEARNAREQMSDLSQMLTLKMTDAWDNLTAAHRKMLIAHESIAQAEENLRLNRNYYDAGLTTVADLLDAQTLYRQAVDSFTDSYCAYRVARAAYLDATGQH